MAIDVTQPEDLQRIAAVALEKHGRIDARFINNAGVIPHRWQHLKVEEWNRTLDVNVRGAFCTE